MYNVFAERSLRVDTRAAPCTCVGDSPEYTHLRSSAKTRPPRPVLSPTYIDCLSIDEYNYLLKCCECVGFTLSPCVSELALALEASHLCTRCAALHEYLNWWLAEWKRGGTGRERRDSGEGECRTYQPFPLRLLTEPGRLTHLPAYQTSFPPLHAFD